MRSQSGIIKIGRTANMGNRLKAHRATVGEKMYILNCIKKAGHYEYFLIKKFSPYRANGMSREWFVLPDSLIDQLTSLTLKGLQKSYDPDTIGDDSKANTSFYLDDDLKSRVKLGAINEKISLSDLIRKAIDKFI